MTAPHERLKQARIAAGFRSASKAAESLGLSAGTYLGHENGHRAFDVEAAKQYSRRFKVTMTWLLTGEGPMSTLRSAQDQEPPAYTEDWPPEVDDSDDSVGVFVAGVPYHPRLPGGRPEIDVRVGAGDGTIGGTVVTSINGHVVSGHKVVSEWVFPETFFRYELNATASSIIIHPIIGESMLPTLAPGDRVIVDTSQCRFTADAIYVFDDGDGEPRVKRLSKVLFSKPEEVHIISDNPMHPAQTVELSRVRIIGRVVGKVSRL